MTHWQPAVERLTGVVEARFAGHPIFEERLNQWRRISDFPPVLVTAEGWLVDGHHRMTVARERGCEVWGVIVERRGEHWIATGNVARVT